MRCQIDKNKEILCDEIEKLSKLKMSEANAAKLSMYRNAYKALCMAEKKDDANYIAKGSCSTQDKQRNIDYSLPYMEHRQIPFSYSMAAKWTADMENSDGSKGPHWSMEQVRHVLEQNEINCDPLQFFAVLNAVYSDYYAVAKKHGVNKMDFYADIAKAWLNDSDAVGDKAARYFEYIVKH